MLGITGCGNEEKNDEGKSDSHESAKDNNTSHKKEGKLSKIITADNYGDKVNYSANGVNDWKIFYNDGENIFIISESLVDLTNLNLGTEYNKYISGLGFSQLMKKRKNFVISDEIAKKYMYKYNIREHIGQGIISDTGVASAFLDTTIWEPYVDTKYAESAIGAPTLEMFVESWNQKGYPKIFYKLEEDTGYLIGLDEDEIEETTLFYDEFDIDEEDKDSLYVIQNGEKCWLSSPMEGYDKLATSGEHGVLGARTIATIDAKENYNNVGLRPVICLKADIEAKYEDGVWNLK